MIFRHPFVTWSLILLILGLACDNVRIVQPVTPRPPTVPPGPMVIPLPSQPPPPPATLPLVVASPPRVEQRCNLPDLAARQHLGSNGSYSDSQWAVSGLMSCRIERDSCAYNHLVGLVDPSIIFKKEEDPFYDVEDVLMHPAMVLPLTTLSQMVQEEWAGEFSLRVTDAYDSLLEHDLDQTDPERKYSLHFEGRAIDLTLWPVDRNQYGRLCALALCAGFDWVHNEITHCHASIRAESLCERCQGN